MDKITVLYKQKSESPISQTYLFSVRFNINELLCHINPCLYFTNGDTSTSYPTQVRHRYIWHYNRPQLVIWVVLLTPKCYNV